MPKNKMKSRSGAKKRFRFTAKGKVLYYSAGKRHILTNKKPKRRRHARGSHVLQTGDAKQVRRMLPYGRT